VLTSRTSVCVRERHRILKSSYYDYTTILLLLWLTLSGEEGEERGEGEEGEERDKEKDKHYTLWKVNGHNVDTQNLTSA
jgi:hypothetical protein